MKYIVIVKQPRSSGVGRMMRGVFNVEPESFFREIKAKSGLEELDAREKIAKDGSINTELAEFRIEAEVW